ncbi:Cro/CI family transcriptional regulator [Serratia fonticola]|uniref:Cro/CI family transcriptional regulator n=1 Tax=Serratia fonticola TaxID=47917 RepID=UPI00209824B8|nr:Cro/CI family transcriptional regulator [Serratia fonticola]MCO7512367.1 Cro/CI family transcriptional regulator [Serratia fonticola]
MKRYSLFEFVQTHGQAKTAEIFGVNQSAISKAVRLCRNVTVYESGDGTFKAEETRPFPHREKPTTNGSSLKPQHEGDNRG